MPRIRWDFRYLFLHRIAGEVNKIDEIKYEDADHLDANHKVIKYITIVSSYSPSFIKDPIRI